MLWQCEPLHFCHDQYVATQPATFCENPAFLTKWQHLAAQEWQWEGHSAHSARLWKSVNHTKKQYSCSPLKHYLDHFTTKPEAERPKKSAFWCTFPNYVDQRPHFRRSIRKVKLITCFVEWHLLPLNRKLEKHITIMAAERTYKTHHHITPPAFVRCIITLLYSQFTQLPGEQGNMSL